MGSGNSCLEVTYVYSPVEPIRQVKPTKFSSPASTPQAAGPADPPRRVARESRAAVALDSRCGRDVPRCSLAVGSGPAGLRRSHGHDPAQIRHAYGFDKITFSAGRGRRRQPARRSPSSTPTTIPNIANDLHQFDVSSACPTRRSPRSIRPAERRCRRPTRAGAPRSRWTWNGPTPSPPEANILLVEAKEQLDEQSDGRGRLCPAGAGRRRRVDELGRRRVLRRDHLRQLLHHPQPATTA